MPARNPTPARRRDRRHGAHALAGFVIGLVAVSTAVFIGEARLGEAPVSAVMQAAAETAAERIATAAPPFDPAALAPDAPSEAGAGIEDSASATAVSFANDGGSDLFTPRYATRIAVPAVGIDADVRPVGYIFTDGQLRYDVPRIEAGQYAGSGQPGRPGNTVIGGHVTVRGGTGIFAALPHVAAGDLVEVYRGDEIFRYSITEIRIVAADATEVMSPTQDATLTLITCFPDDHNSDRLVVTGKLIRDA